jgi:hypothetical protein
MADALIPGRGKIIDPRELKNLGPEGGCHVFGPVGGAGIDDDDFIGDPPSCLFFPVAFYLFGKAEVAWSLEPEFAI